MNSIDDILYSPIGNETENHDLEQKLEILPEVNEPEPTTLTELAAKYPCLNWQMQTSQLQQTLSQAYRQNNPQLNQQLYQGQSLQQWSSLNQAMQTLQQQTIQTQLLTQLGSQQAQQTLEMVIADWWVNTSPPYEE